MNLIEEVIGVILGGAIGSLSRFLLSRWVNTFLPKNFPWGIFVVNILGCFVLGILAAVLLNRQVLTPFWRAGIFLGLLGGFTTFSSFSLDALTLWISGVYWTAGFYVLGSVVLCLLATALGMWLVKIF